MATIAEEINSELLRVREVEKRERYRGETLVNIVDDICRNEDNSCVRQNRYDLLSAEEERIVLNVHDVLSFVNAVEVLDGKHLLGYLTPEEKNIGVIDGRFTNISIDPNTMQIVFENYTAFDQILNIRYIDLYQIVRYEACRCYHPENLVIIRMYHQNGTLYRIMMAKAPC